MTEILKCKSQYICNFLCLNEIYSQIMPKLALCDLRFVTMFETHVGLLLYILDISLPHKYIMDISLFAIEKINSNCVV